MNEKNLTMKKKLEFTPLMNLVILIAAIAIAAVLVNLFLDGQFLVSKNVRNILSSIVYPCFIAWAFCFMLACGYTDLSLGSVLILGSMIIGFLGNEFGYVGVVVGGLAIGTLLVMINFSVFAFTKVPSWIASVSLTLVYEAIAVFLRGHKSTSPYFDVELDRAYRAFGKFPLNIILLIIGFVIIYLLYNHTTIGMNIRAIGGNAKVSQAMGIHMLKTLLWVGLICGLLMGAACLVQESYNGKTNAASALTSIQQMFKPLAIALLAQVLQKRINIIIAVPFCSLIIYGIFNIMTFFGIPSGTFQEVCLGLFVILFGVLGQRGTKEVVK